MLTEEQFGIEFQKIIYHSNNMNSKNIPKFNLIFKEVKSIQGIPDYVGLKIKTNQDMVSLRKINRIRVDYLSNVSKILPYVKRKASHSEEYFSEKTGLPLNVIKKVFKYLIEEKIVECVENTKYVLSNDFAIPEIEMWSFELKLSNWKRAIFQTLRYKTFSDYTYIVMPIDKKNIINENKHIFKEHNIGVILFDYISGDIDVCIRPLKNNNILDSHALYILGQLLMQYQTGKRIKI